MGSVSKAPWNPSQRFRTSPVLFHAIPDVISAELERPKMEVDVSTRGPSILTLKQSRFVFILAFSEVLTSPGATQENGWMFQSDLPQCAALCLSDVPAEEGLAWVKRMTRHSAASFASPLSHAGYLDAPVSYLLCEDDRIIPADVQRSEINMIERKSGQKVGVKTISSGHCPNVSHPQVVVDWLVDLASS